jgi:aspartate-semialdehyde dehydrogenase
MRPRSTNGNGHARVALVGAATSDGTRVRDALSSRGVPGERVDLYGGGADEPVLTEYDSEARLVQAADPAEIAAHDLIFLCERGELADNVVRAAGAGAVVIDVVDALPERYDPLLVHMDVNPEASQGHGGFLALPHPLTILLAEVLHPLEREIGIAEVTAVILRPAADFGDPGVEELREQTVRLLNFAQIPVQTFGSQLAFNILPQRRLAGDLGGEEAQVEAQLTRLLGWGENRISVRLFTAPLFFGHGLQLRVLFDGAATVERIGEVLGASELVEVGTAGPSASPMDVSEQRQLKLAEVSEDGLGGFWLWLVAGETDRRRSEQAIRLAERLSAL